MEKLGKRFGRALRQAREARRLTQAQLAERVGMAPEALGRLERGVSLPRASTLVELAGALGTSVDDLLGVQAGRGGAVPGDLQRIVELAQKLPARKRQLIIEFLEAFAG